MDISDMIEPQEANDKVERMNTNNKTLDGQHESIVCEKLNMQHQLEQFKQKIESQKLQIIALQRQIDLFKENGMKIADTFNSLKGREEMHDTGDGALKRKFEEQVTEFLKDEQSENDNHQSAVFVESVDNENDQISSVAASSNNQTQLMENIADRNQYHTTKARVHERTQGSRCYVAMRKMSDTTVKRLTSTTTTKATTSSKTPQTQLLGGKFPLVVLRRMVKEAVPNRPKRHSTCSLCSKRCSSGSATALCTCVQKYL